MAQISERLCRISKPSPLPGTLCRLHPSFGREPRTVGVMVGATVGVTVSAATVTDTVRDLHLEFAVVRTLFRSEALPEKNKVSCHEAFAVRVVSASCLTTVS